ncbi:hypothetical protein ES703_59229 [subsurface metagenome]
MAVAAPSGAAVIMIVSPAVKPAPAIVILEFGLPLGGLIVTVACPSPSPILGITPKPKGTLTVSLSLMPSMLSEYGPGTTPVPTLILAVALLDEPGDTVTLADGENTAVTPSGRPLKLSVTVLPVVVTEVTVTVAFADVP